jgi:formylglycine-generating enzyme required for sulfatase activity
VNRGGSWNNDAQNCRVSNRNNNDPTNRNNNLGFRLARSSKSIFF